jgi:hypothetical protein
MSLVETLGVVVPTPPEYRVLISEAEVLATLRCSPEELAELVAAGLPHEDGKFDYYDVWNLGLLSGSGRSKPEWIMFSFARALKSFRADWVSPRRYEIKGTALCPRAENCPSAEWATPALPSVQWQREDARCGRGEWHGQVEMRGSRATVLDPRVRGIWDRLTEQYRFHYTPVDLSDDVASTIRRRVGDCDALSHILLDELTALGIAAEIEPGYIFGGARLGHHSWLRIVDSDGESKTLDPAMALLADIFFTPEYRAFCYGSTVNRTIPLASYKDMFASHSCADGKNRITYEFSLRQVHSQ